jgi:hypothetical protein
MGHLIAIDPRDVSVIDVGDLKHGVYSWISGSPFAKDHLTHPPIVIQWMSNLLCCLNDHPITSLDAEKRWSFLPA